MADSFIKYEEVNDPRDIAERLKRANLIGTQVRSLFAMMVKGIEFNHKSPLNLPNTGISVLPHNLSSALAILLEERETVFEKELLRQRNEESDYQNGLIEELISYDGTNPQIKNALTAWSKLRAYDAEVEKTPEAETVEVQPEEKPSEQTEKDPEQPGDKDIDKSKEPGSDEPDADGGDTPSEQPEEEEKPPEEKPPEEPPEEPEEAVPPSQTAPPMAGVPPIPGAAEVGGGGPPEPSKGFSAREVYKASRQQQVVFLAQVNRELDETFRTLNIPRDQQDKIRQQVLFSARNDFLRELMLDARTQQLLGSSDTLDRASAEVMQRLIKVYAKKSGGAPSHIDQLAAALAKKDLSYSRVAKPDQETVAKEAKEATQVAASIAPSDEEVISVKGLVPDLALDGLSENVLDGVLSGDSAAQYLILPPEIKNVLNTNDWQTITKVFASLERDPDLLSDAIAFIAAREGSQLTPAEIRSQLKKFGAQKYLQSILKDQKELKNLFDFFVSEKGQSQLQQVVADEFDQLRAIGDRLLNANISPESREQLLALLSQSKQSSVLTAITQQLPMAPHQIEKLAELRTLILKPQGPGTSLLQSFKALDEKAQAAAPSSSKASLQDKGQMVLLYQDLLLQKKAADSKGARASEDYYLAVRAIESGIAGLMDSKDVMSIVLFTQTSITFTTVESQEVTFFELGQMMDHQGQDSAQIQVLMQYFAAADSLSEQAQVQNYVQAIQAEAQQQAHDAAVQAAKMRVANLGLNLAMAYASGGTTAIKEFLVRYLENPEEMMKDWEAIKMLLKEKQQQILTAGAAIGLTATFPLIGGIITFLSGQGGLFGGALGGALGRGASAAARVAPNLASEAISANAGTLGQVRAAISNAPGQLATGVQTNVFNPLNSFARTMTTIAPGGGLVAMGILSPLVFAAFLTIIVITVIGGSLNDWPAVGSNRFTVGGGLMLNTMDMDCLTIDAQSYLKAGHTVSEIKYLEDIVIKAMRRSRARTGCKWFRKIHGQTAKFKISHEAGTNYNPLFLMRAGNNLVMDRSYAKKLLTTKEWGPTVFTFGIYHEIGHTIQSGSGMQRAHDSVVDWTRCTVRQGSGCGVEGGVIGVACVVTYPLYLCGGSADPMYESAAEAFGWWVYLPDKPSVYRYYSGGNNFDITENYSNIMNAYDKLFGT